MNRSRIALVASSSWIARIVTSSVALVSTPILISSLGEEGYAAWAVLAGLAPWIGLVQFGFGAALQNAVAYRIAHGAEYSFLVRRGFLAALLPAVVATVGLVVFAAPLAEALLGKFTQSSRETLTAAFLITSLGFIAQSVFGLISGVWFAENRGYYANVLPAVATTSGLVAYVLSHEAVPDTARLPLACGCFFVPLGVLFCVGYCARLFRRRPARAAVDGGESAYDHLVRQGLKHWGFAAMANAVLSIDYLVISQSLAANEIITYSVTAKIFTLVFFVFNAVLLAIAPSITQAAARNEWTGAFRLLRLNVAFGIVVVVVATVVLLGYSAAIFDILAPGTNAHPGTAFVISYAAYLLLRIWTDTFACVLTSQNVLTPLYVAVPFQAAISLGLQLVLVPIYREMGVTLALTASFLLTTAWFLPHSVFARIRKTRDTRPSPLTP